MSALNSFCLKVKKGGRRFCRGKDILTYGALLIFGFFSFPLHSQDSEKDYAVQKIAETLKRLGERDIADRFLRDYANHDASHSQVRFEDLGGEGVNAETGPDFLRRFTGGPNHLTLDTQVLEQVSHFKKILEKDPYGRSSTLLSWAATVYHEYVHMDQDSPKNTAKFEDKAWQKTDKAIVRWYRKLYDEFDFLKSQPNSAKKGEKLLEIKNILSLLDGVMTTQKEGIERNVKDGVLTAGQTWESKRAYPLVGALIEKVKKEMKKNAGQDVSTHNGSGRWVLTKKFVKSQLHPDGTSSKISFSGATISVKNKPTDYEAYYKKQKMQGKFSFSWSKIFSFLELGKRYKIILKVSDAGSIPEKNNYGEIVYPSGEIDSSFVSCPFKKQSNECIPFFSTHSKGTGYAHTKLPSTPTAQAKFIITPPSVDEALGDLPKYHPKSELKEEIRIRISLSVQRSLDYINFVYTWDPTGTLKPIAVTDTPPKKLSLPTSLPPSTLPSQQPSYKSKKNGAQPQAVREIFSTNNIYSVNNAPTAATTFTLDKPYFFSEITTYHWNNGRGTAKPGTIAVIDDQGNFYGSWTATGKAGQGNVPNAYWSVTPKRIFQPGTYTILDSDPSTWSQNAHSGGQGIVVVKGYPVP